MTETAKPAMARGEFIPLAAMMISLIALSIDAMLPVLPQIGDALGASSANQQQMIIIALFAGLGFAQIIYGPLSDSFGRKRLIYAGYVIFVCGCILSITAQDMQTMLVGRFLQGVGAAGPRIVTIAMVRDQYAGRDMATIMSFVMGVFIMVPAIAPALGQLIAIQFEWRAIFVSFVILAVFTWTWYAVRHPETLPKEKRLPFSLAAIAAGIKEAASSRIALGYTLITGFIFSGLVTYLSTAPQIFADIFDITEQFPLYFGALALAIGVSSVMNGRLVGKYGMRRLSLLAMLSLIGLSVLFGIYCVFVDFRPGLIPAMIWLVPTFLALGMLFGNVNALAMEPLGHIAGIGAAFIGTISTLISALMGGLMGATYNGSILPMILGFGGFGLVSLVIRVWAEKPQS